MTAADAAYVMGTLMELDPDERRVTLRVAGSRGVLVRSGEEVTVDARRALVLASDGDGDGLPGLTDLYPGDTVLARLKPHEAGAPLVASRLEQRSRGARAGSLRPLWAAWRS